MLIAVSIPEEMITQNLNYLLSSSDPGDEIHHLLVVACPKAAIGPLGLADEKKLEMTVYAIVVDASVDPVEFAHKVIATAGVSHAERDLLPLFAGVSQKTFLVECVDESVERLHAERRLAEHPDGVEVTTVYAACRDGRRWGGVRYLTGPKADNAASFQMLVGKLTEGEAESLTARLVRRLVGIPED